MTRFLEIPSTFESKFTDSQTDIFIPNLYYSKKFTHALNNK